MADAPPLDCQESQAYEAQILVSSTGVIPQVRTGQLYGVASSDCHLLGQMGWNLGYLFHEALYS